MASAVAVKRYRASHPKLRNAESSEGQLKSYLYCTTDLLNCLTKWPFSATVKALYVMM
jgi:hypothetical protein